MDDFLKILAVVSAIIAIILVFAVLLAIPTMLLWNILMPGLFGLKTISIWQAIGLNLLCGILFKSNVNASKTN